VIELWHEWNSVHSFKVRVVLREKGVEWTDLRLNPNGVVPTLVHDGEAVLESSIICQYLDDLFPDPALLPAAPRPRGRCRAWLKYFDDMVHPAVRKASFEILYVLTSPACRLPSCANACVPIPIRCAQPRSCTPQRVSPTRVASLIL
jgi:glutathione S-transferase